MALYAAGMKDNGMPQDFQTGNGLGSGEDRHRCVAEVGPNATAAQLHAYIEDLHGYTGITGTYDFRDGSQRGLGVDSTLIMRWDPEKSGFVSVSKGGGAPL